MPKKFIFCYSPGLDSRRRFSNVSVDVKLKIIENDVIGPFQHLLSDLIEKCLEYIPLIIERAE